MSESEKYITDRAKLLGDENQQFSIASAQEALKELIDLIPKTRKASAFGAANEVAITLADAQSLIQQSERKHET